MGKNIIIIIIPWDIVLHKSQKNIISMCFKGLPVKTFTHILLWHALYLNMYTFFWARKPHKILTNSVWLLD